MVNNESIVSIDDTGQAMVKIHFPEWKFSPEV